MEKLIKAFGVIAFGLVFPVIVLFQAHASISALGNDVSYATTLGQLSNQVSAAKSEAWDVNQIALYSLLYVEHANQKTMINKQLMKTSIVNIGFAVISIGMMLIVLGIEKDNNVQASGKMQGLNFDVKTGSTGVAIFLVGAVMATLGGVLKNNYKTSEIPTYTVLSKGDYSESYEKSVAAYKTCRDQKTDFELCFTQIFFQINSSVLK